MDYPTFADAHFLLGKTSHARIRLELEKLRTDAELWKTITVRIRKHVGNGHPRAAFLDDRVTASNEYLAAIDAQLKSDAPATANLPSIPAPGSKDLDGLLVLTHGWVRTNYGSKPSQNPNYLNTETAVAPVVEFLAPEFMLSVKFSGEYTDGPAAATAKANDDYDSLGGKAFRWTSPHGIKTVQIDEKELAAWANLYQALKSGDQSAAAIISHKSWASTRFAGGVARLPANHTMLIEHFETGQRNSRYWLTIRDIWGNDQRIDLGNGLTHPFQNN